MKAALALTLALANPAAAEAVLALSLPVQAVTAAVYACPDGTEVAVRYLESGPNHLALLALPEGELVFVNVLAASGARYVAGPWEWWTRGETARLSNAMQGGGGMECQVRP